MHVTPTIQPTMFVDSGRIDDESISLPLSNRVTHPGFAKTFRMVPPIRPDLSNFVIPLEQYEYPFWRLHDLDRALQAKPGHRYTARKALRLLRIHFVSIISFIVDVVLVLFRGPGLHGKRVCVVLEDIPGFARCAEPNPRQIGGLCCRHGLSRSRLSCILCAGGRSE